MEDNLNIEELQAEIEARRREIDTRRREIARILYRGDYGNANWEAEYDARVQENPEFAIEDEYEHNVGYQLDDFEVDRVQELRAEIQDLEATVREAQNVVDQYEVVEGDEIEVVRKDEIRNQINTQQVERELAEIRIRMIQIRNEQDDPNLSDDRRRELEEERARIQSRTEELLGIPAGNPSGPDINSARLKLTDAQRAELAEDRQRVVNEAQAEIDYANDTIPLLEELLELENVSGINFEAINASEVDTRLGALREELKNLESQRQMMGLSNEDIEKRLKEIQQEIEAEWQFRAQQENGLEEHEDDKYQDLLAEQKRLQEEQKRRKEQDKYKELSDEEIESRLQEIQEQINDEWQFRAQQENGLEEHEDDEYQDLLAEQKRLQEEQERRKKESQVSKLSDEDIKKRLQEIDQQIKEEWQFRAQQENGLEEHEDDEYQDLLAEQKRLLEEQKNRAQGKSTQDLDARISKIKNQINALEKLPREKVRPREYVRKDGSKTDKPIDHDHDHDNHDNDPPHDNGAKKQDDHDTARTTTEQELAEKNEKLGKLEVEIERAEKQLKELQEKVDASKEELEKLKAEIASLVEQKNALTAEIAELERKKAELEGKEPPKQTTGKGTKDTEDGGPGKTDETKDKDKDKDKDKEGPETDPAGGKKGKGLDGIETSNVEVTGFWANILLAIIHSIRKLFGKEDFGANIEAKLVARAAQKSLSSGAKANIEDFKRLQKEAKREEKRKAKGKKKGLFARLFARKDEPEEAKKDEEKEEEKLETDAAGGAGGKKEEKTEEVEEERLISPAEADFTWVAARIDLVDEPGKVSPIFKKIAEAQNKRIEAMTDEEVMLELADGNAQVISSDMDARKNLRISSVIRRIQELAEKAGIELKDGDRVKTINEYFPELSEKIRKLQERKVKVERETEGKDHEQE